MHHSTAENARQKKIKEVFKKSKKTKKNSIGGKEETPLQKQGKEISIESRQEEKKKKCTNQRSRTDDLTAFAPNIQHMAMGLL